MLVGKGYTDRVLTEEEIRDLMADALAQADVSGQRVLVIIPDHTRTAPIPLFFRLFHEIIGGEVAALDYLVALGTHRPMSQAALNRLVGITAEERATQLADTLQRREAERTEGIAALQAKLEEARQEAQAFARQVTELEAEVERQRKRAEELVELLQAQEVQARESTQVALYEEELKELAEARRALERDLATWRERAEAAEREWARLEAELEALRAEERVQRAVSYTHLTLPTKA